MAANRQFQQFRLSLEKQVVDLFADVTLGCAGLTTLRSGKCKGVASIARTGTGKYDVTFQDTYVRLLGVKHCFINASTAPAAPLMYQVTSQVTTVSAPKVTIQFTNASGTATDPADSEECLLVFTLLNSTAY